MRSPASGLCGKGLDLCVLGCLDLMYWDGETRATGRSRGGGGGGGGRHLVEAATADVEGEALCGGS